VFAPRFVSERTNKSIISMMHHQHCRESIISMMQRPNLDDLGENPGGGEGGGWGMCVCVCVCVFVLVCVCVCVCVCAATLKVHDTATTSERGESACSKPCPGFSFLSFFSHEDAPPPKKKRISRNEFLCFLIFTTTGDKKKAAPGLIGRMRFFPYPSSSSPAPLLHHLSS
jgi:hypothetical protein